MDILKIYLKFAKVLKQSKGFTLIELLVAIAMSGIVLTGLGAGMMALLNSSNSSNAKTNVKNQLNRAIDYINEDIKRARFAGIATTNTTGDTLRLIYFESAASNESHRIDYFMASSSNPWFGPNVIRRSVDGGASQVLVDGITDNSGITFPTCSTGTSYTTGFQACVTKTNQSNRAVDVYRVNISLFGELSNSTEIQVETQSIARSVSPELTPPTLKSDPNQITISLDPTPVIIWNLVPGSVSYQIYRCTVPVDQEVCTPTESSTVVYNNAIPSFTETANAPVGSRWCYAGSSSDGVNASPLGNVVCAAVSNGGLPATVTNLDASDTVVPTVTWGAATDADTYSLYRCPADAVATCTPNTLVFGPETQLNFTETQTPAANKKWCYAVKATNEAGVSPESNVDCGLVNSSAIPNVPTITIDANNTNIVNWSDESTSGATSYSLYQCEIDGGSTCPPTTLATGFPQFTNTFTQSVAAAVNNRWCYAVKAINTTPDPDKESAISSTVCGDISLAAPTFTNAPFSGVAPTVNWSSIASATSYELYRCTTTDLVTVCNPSTGVEVTTANYTNTSYTESSEPPNSNRHCYAVRAKNSGGSSVFSSTSCGAEKIAVCTIPNVMSYATSTADQRTFVINQVTNAGFGTPTTVNQDSGTGAGETVWSVSPAVGSTVLCSSAITIKWKEGAGVAVPPNAPMLISVSGADTNTSTVALSWVSGGGGMAVGYDLYRCITATGGTCNPTSGGTLVGSNIGTTFTNNGPVDLQGNKNACYALKAKNSGGTSGFSNQRCDK